MAMIVFSYHIPGFRLKQTRTIKAWIISCITSEKKKAGKIYVHWVDEKQLLNLNRKYLKHDTHTDIITFDYSDQNTLSGELFICPERIRENACIYENGNVEKEILRVLIHGILHLCGYHDKNKKDKIHFRKKEDFYIRRFNRKKTCI